MYIKSISALKSMACAEHFMLVQSHNNHDIILILKDEEGIEEHKMEKTSMIEREILPAVNKPLRYIGSEYNAVKKNWEQSKIKMLFAFPDVYEVGMSHLGMKILYHLVNDRPHFLMERVFAPWTDMEKIMREKNIPLFGLESGRSMLEYDCIGFTLQYEMSYTNILNMLDLGGIPLLASIRDTSYPLIIGGGPCVSNPEPLADYFDLFVLGEAEEVLLLVLEKLAELKLKVSETFDKKSLLTELTSIKGVYVPAFYKPEYDQEGKIKAVSNEEENIDLPRNINKNVIQNLDEAYFPTKPIVPYVEIIHDRVMLEVMRGCSRGCRFCQAGMIYRPVRERTVDVLYDQADKLMTNTGYNELALTSLSTSDYTCIRELLSRLLEKYEEDKVSISLPSLRIDAFSVGLAREVQRVRRTGLTFAPEAGTQRLRDVINKGVTEENLMEVVRAAFEAGWTQIKLYFMIGLPTETSADLDGIIDLVYKVLQLGAKILRDRGIKKQPKITVSISSFVPKAHTPFQWEDPERIEALLEKQIYLRGRIKDRRIALNYHDARLSALEAVFARGGREIGEPLYKAWSKGCKFDAWSEHFDFEKWQEAFKESGLEIEAASCLNKDKESVFPWEHLNMGVSKEFLWRERGKAYRGETTTDCRNGGCTDCGACRPGQAEIVLCRRWDG